jgi:ribosome maturation factor RimP
VGLAPAFLFVERNFRMLTASQSIADQVAPLAERVARRTGCELAYVRFVNEGSDWVLRIVIDRDGGVGVHDCASVSRQMSAMLDVDDFIPHAYNLEVSSPGLDAELLVARDYEKYAGRAVRIQTRDEIEGKTTFRGTLRGLRGGIVLVEDGDGTASKIPLKQVEGAFLEVEI